MPVDKLNGRLRRMYKLLASASVRTERIRAISAAAKCLEEISYFSWYKDGRPPRTEKENSR